mgnify:CR=1 FL=1
MTEPTEEPTYDEVMVQANKPPPPPLSSVDKKRLNKTVTCPLCNKQVNSKTMKYTHDCQKTKKEKQTPQITDDHIKQYIMQQQQVQEEQQQAIKQDKFNKLIRNMI